MKITVAKSDRAASPSGYWFQLRHGLGPGTLPKDVTILDRMEEGWKDYVQLDRFLTTEELNFYDIRESVPPQLAEDITSATQEEKNFRKLQKVAKKFGKQTNKIATDVDNAQEDMFEKYNKLLKQGQEAMNTSAATNTCNGFAADMSNCLADDEIEAADYNFGGAFDIEPDMLFTREEVDEFAAHIADSLNDEFKDCTVSVKECGMDSTVDLTCVFDVEFEGNQMESEASAHIDLRRIRSPRDLVKNYSHEVYTEVRRDILDFIEDCKRGI